MPSTEGVYQASVNDMNKPAQRVNSMIDRWAMNRVMYRQRNPHKQSLTSQIADTLKDVFSAVFAKAKSTETAADVPTGMLATERDFALVETMAAKGLMRQDEASALLNRRESGNVTIEQIAQAVDNSMAEGLARRLHAEGAISAEEMATAGLYPDHRATDFEARNVEGFISLATDGDAAAVYGQMRGISDLSSVEGSELEISEGWFFTFNQADATLKRHGLYPVAASDFDRHGFRMVDAAEDVLKHVNVGEITKDSLVCEISPSMITKVTDVFARNGIAYQAEEVSSLGGPEHDGNIILVANRQDVIEGFGDGTAISQVIEEVAAQKNRPSPQMRVESSPVPEKSVAMTEAQFHDKLNKSINQAIDQAKHAPQVARPVAAPERGPSRK